MDNDSIRSVGATTLVEIWIDGKLRSICVTRAAISARCRLIASVLHHGRTRPATAPLSGQIAPKM